MSTSNLRLQDVRRLLRLSGEYELSDSAIQRLKWFQYNLEHEGNVSLTCRHFGISRSTYVRWAQRFDASDLRTLEESSRRPHTVRLPETDTRTVDLIRAIRTQQPLLGKMAVAEILRKNHGIAVSSSTVGRIIKRHGLFFGQTASHHNKRTSLEDHTVLLPPPEKISAHGETDIDDPLISLAHGLTS